MARGKEGCRSGCPISFGLDIFGDKWTLLLIRDILFKGKRTYKDFFQSEEGIATNILADRLDWLEKQKILRKARDPKDHRGHVYGLTRKGIDLLPLMLEIIRWSAKYDPKTAAPTAFVRRLKTDREGLMRDILSSTNRAQRRRVRGRRG